MCTDVVKMDSITLSLSLIQCRSYDRRARVSLAKCKSSGVNERARQQLLSQSKESRLPAVSLYLVRPIERARDRSQAAASEMEDLRLTEKEIGLR